MQPLVVVFGLSLLSPRGGGNTLGIPGGGVPPISPNSDPISDQKMSLSTPVFRPVVH